VRVIASDLSYKTHFPNQIQIKSFFSEFSHLDGKVMHILSGAMGTFHDDVGMFVKDESAPHTQILAAGLFQKPAGRLTAFGL